MRVFRTSLFCALVAAAVPVGGALVSRDAHASVSIAVLFDALVKDADSVAIVTPVEQHAVWEDGRICTYTRVRVENGVAGELGAGAEGWVRTLGGVVDHIGQSVEGEAVFVLGRQSLVFLRHGPVRASGTYEVSARAQGQFPVTVDESTSQAPQTGPVRPIKRLVRSSAVGVLFPPKASDLKALTRVDPAVSGKLAAEVIHGRAVDDAVRDIAAAWNRLHAK